MEFATTRRKLFWRTHKGEVLMPKPSPTPSIKKPTPKPTPTLPNTPIKK